MYIWKEKAKEKVRPKWKTSTCIHLWPAMLLCVYTLFWVCVCPIYACVGLYWSDGDVNIRRVSTSYLLETRFDGERQEQ
jgi:hypothetical protein